MVFLMPWGPFMLDLQGSHVLCSDQLYPRSFRYYFCLLLVLNLHSPFNYIDQYICYLQLNDSLFINFYMTTTFSSASRLANFREKKIPANEQVNDQNQLKLTLPQNSDTNAYQPTVSFNNSRTNTRLLRGRIDKGKSTEKQSNLQSANVLTEPMKLTINQKPSDLKLVINDSPNIRSKKASVQEKAQSKQIQKRILIAKEQPKQQIPKKQQQKVQEKQVQNKQMEEKKVHISPQVQEKGQKYENYFNPHDEKPIKEQQIEESKEPQLENENDLVLCPEGCGRKFNRKALEKHAKACKLVFMSKRKQFNSEAKRLTSKEQASMIKQNKLKEKSQFGKTKGKGLDKTSDNWKAASEDFRSALKAVKKDEKEGQNDEAVLNLVGCQFCQKKFAEVLLEKHLQNCVRKKEKQQKEKKKTKKK